MNAPALRKVLSNARCLAWTAVFLVIVGSTAESWAQGLSYNRRVESIAVVPSASSRF